MNLLRRLLSKKKPKPRIALGFKTKPHLDDLGDVLTFGKYKGKTVEYVLDVNSSYILWLAENEVVVVSDEIYEMAEINDRCDTKRGSRYYGYFPDDDSWYGAIDPYDFMDEPF